ncbi:MAG TPA: hypothetical protein VF278_14230 [Pirellulales bacterium]
MTRVLNDGEMLLAGQLFSLTDIVSAASQIVAAKKQAFTAAQNELRAAEAGLQKAQEDLAAFIKGQLGAGSA